MAQLQSPQFDKFQSVLRGMFMLDHAELDFGIYRIMNQKRKDIDVWLSDKLREKVQQVLRQNQSATTADKEAELQKAITQARDLGIDPETLPKVHQLREEIAATGSSEDFENEVYSHLSTFFARYYDEGDFISQRRYKRDVYAIPYEGEEVKLHWANADQYYIKTAEYFRNYSFRLPSGKTVEFALREAATEQNNNKVQGDQRRLFALYEPDSASDPEGKSVEADGDTLRIWFTYQLYPKSTKQKDLAARAYEAVKALVPTAFYEALALRPAEKDKNRTLLQKHITDYVARNQFDYFIHKDLRRFLTRELDFYVKNEMLFIDDIDAQRGEQFLAFLAVVKAVKTIGGEIIGFLASLEDYQKRLWEKRKFVTQADYCITLDHIAPEFYAEIAANDRQREEWVRLFAIDKIEGNAFNDAYSVPLTEKFLTENKFLPIDTALFSADFRQRLLATIDDIDSKTNGLLINSENFQALRLLQEEYAGQVNVVYIDPPYNTVHSEILYKNQYKHSSWLTLLNNTLSLVPRFWNKEYSFGLSIDDFEMTNISKLLDDKFPELEKSMVIVNHHPQGAGGRLSRTHEYLILLSQSTMPSYLGEPVEAHQEDRSFMRSGTADNNYRYGRWKSFYALLYDPKTKKIVGAEDPVPLDVKYPTDVTEEGYERIYPINSRGEERVWRSSYLTGRNRAENGELWLSDGGSIYQSIDHDDNREVLFSNWTDAKFNAGTQGANILNDMGLKGTFDYPKSIKTIEVALWAQSFGNLNAVVMDYFAGSGTTGHAVINLNRDDANRQVKANRKYILVEMGDYFDTVTKPRVLKAAYSKEWKDGAPVSRDGVSQIVKVVRLEQYEDTLNNLVVRRPGEIITDRFEETRLLGYMLDTETRDSLFNLTWFDNPFDVRLRITRGNETREQQIDMVETFNYLIGLRVDSIAWPKDGLCTLTGRTRRGEKTLVIWRDVNKVDSTALNDFFTRSAYSTRDNEFDVIYVNGDNRLENIRQEGDTWKVRLTEETFQKKMFEEA